MFNKIIDINEYKKRMKSGSKDRRKRSFDCIYPDPDEEERKKTLNLFIKVIETMKNESYK